MGKLPTVSEVLDGLTLLAFAKQMDRKLAVFVRQYKNGGDHTFYHPTCAMHSSNAQWFGGRYGFTVAGCDEADDCQFCGGRLDLKPQSSRED